MKSAMDFYDANKFEMALEISLDGRPFVTTFSHFGEIWMPDDIKGKSTTLTEVYPLYTRRIACHWLGGALSPATPITTS